MAFWPIVIVKMREKLENILEKVYLKPEQADIAYLLSLDDSRQQEEIFVFADKVRKKFVGDGILLRGIIEFSNHCRNSCFYCGLNKNNRKLQRYRLTQEEILRSVKFLAEQKIKTVVLQSGEEDGLDSFWLAEVISRIKREFDLAITLCVGERPQDDYKLWKNSGADRYLLKIETTNEKLYTSLHPQMSFANRLKCLKGLCDLGFQVGSGNIIGLKNQTLADIAQDIIFFKSQDLDMIGIGPFIPHSQTELSGHGHGDVGLTLRTLALTRIVCRNAHIPATTALASLNKDYRLQGLRAGANVLMPNFTPMDYKELYEIYPGKKCLTEFADTCVSCMAQKATAINRYIDYSRGDALEKKVEV